MTLYCLPTIDSKSLSRLKSQQSVNKVLQFLTHSTILPLSISFSFFDYLLELLLLFNVLNLERKLKISKMISKYSKCPKIDISFAFSSNNHLRSEVSPCSILKSARNILLELLGNSKVSQLHIAIIKYQTVRWL